MAEPLTKAELALARGYAESVYADTTDPQKHAAAVMMLRLLDTLAALEAENARLKPPAAVEPCVRCGRAATKDAAGHYLSCCECCLGPLCQDCHDLHAQEETIIQLKHENARLRPLAKAVDAYYAAFMASSATDHCDKALKRTADAEWTRLLDLAALRAAKKTPTTKAVEANDE